MITHRLTAWQRVFRPRLSRLPPGRRVYAVGDVHGQLERLHELHDAIRRDLVTHPASEPTLVHIGDLIDRGPDSAGVVDLLAAGPPVPDVPTVNLMGNHEWMLLSALARHHDDAAEHWLANGGGASLASWGIAPDVPPEEWLDLIPRAHLVFLRDLRRTWRQDGYLFVHAGVRPMLRVSDQVADDLLWIREPFLNWRGAMLPDAPEVAIVHGHTPVPQPVVRRNRIGIDTGAGKGGPLTCAVLEGADVRFLQA